MIFTLFHPREALAYITLTPLSPCKMISYCIGVPSYKSFHSSFIKPAHQRYCVSSIKSVPVVVHNCSVYNFYPVARNECAHIYVNNATCKTFGSLMRCQCSP